jgi:uncharacterized protein (DUF433 family)
MVEQPIQTIDGKPPINGTHITVMDIAAMYVMNGSSIEWIIDEYGLNPSQIHAAIAYYYDNREAIDRAIANEEAEMKANGTSLDTLIERARLRQQSQ